MVAAIAAAWGFIGVIVRWVELPAVAIVVSRCWIAVLVLGARWLVLRHRGDRRSLVPTHRRIVLLLGVLLAVHWCALVAAQQRAPIGTVLLITYLAPVVVTVLAPRVLGEVVPRTTVAALVVALAGTVLLARPTVDGWSGIGLALVAAATWGAITLLSKKVVGDLGGANLALAQLGVAALVLTPVATTVHWGSPQMSWWWLAVLGGLFTGVLVGVYLTMLDRLPAATVGVITYVEPVSAVLCGWVFLAEVPDAVTVVGGAMVLVAGIAVVRWSTASSLPLEGRALSRVPR